jgi:hypothetical protein
LKVLVYVPLAPKRPRIYARTIMSLFNLEWKESLPIVFGKEDFPRGTKYENLTAKHNQVREMFLAGDYDALFMTENDMVLPIDTLKRLVAVNSDVAYGLYCSRHGRYRWLAFLEIMGYHGLSVSDSENLAKEHWGQVKETKGIGMGCTLIKRKVLEEITFRTAPNDIVADDWLFSLDCIDKKFSQVHDFGLVCGHIALDKVIWPDPYSSFCHRIEFFDESQLVEVKPGEKVGIESRSFGLTGIYGGLKSPDIMNPVSIALADLKEDLKLCE